MRGKLPCGALVLFACVIVACASDDQSSTQLQLVDTPQTTPEVAESAERDSLDATSREEAASAREITVQTPAEAQTPAAYSMEATGGHVVVRNLTEGLWSANERWRLCEVWTAGVVEGDPDLAFANISNVSLGPDGRVYAIDFTIQCIIVLDGDGEFVRRIGRAGRGPGEFNGPLSMAWDSQDRLWIADAWNQRYTIIDTSLAVVHAVPRKVEGISGWSQRLLFRHANELVDQTSWMTDGVHHTGFVRLDTLGTILERFPPLSGERSIGADIDPVQMIQDRDALKTLSQFLPQLVIGLAPDASVWFAMSGTYSLVQRTAGGDTLRVVHTNHRNIPLSGDERRTIRAALRQAQLPDDIAQFGAQIIKAIHVLSDGHVLVHIGLDGRAGTQFDVFDPEGRLLGAMDTPLNLSSATLASRGDTIVAVSLDEMNVTYITRFVIQKP